MLSKEELPFFLTGHEGETMQYCYILGLLFLITYNLAAEPPRQIPEELWSRFTCNGEIPVTNMYLDGTTNQTEPNVYSKEVIDELVAKADRREQNYYGQTDEYLYNALSTFSITGKDVAIIGSVVPWYEAIVLSFDGKPTTIEYNKIVTDHPLLEVMTVEEYAKTPRKFDVVLSVSSLEHDGLGRYGDPINPDGDIQWMRQAKGMLKEGGLLILSIPVGKDHLFWNAHRQYGEKRINKIFEGWRCVATFGFSPCDLNTFEYTGHQPVFVLAPA